MAPNEYQAVWVTHTDTGRPHVHVVAKLVHPVTGKVARLGLIKKRMSAFCAAYEQALGDVRCKARLTPRAANGQRARAPKRQMPEKQRASFVPALPLTVSGIPDCTAA